MLIFPYQCCQETCCGDDLGGADFGNGADTVVAAEDAYIEPAVLSYRGCVMKTMTPSAVVAADVLDDVYQHDDDYEFAFAAAFSAVDATISAFLVHSEKRRQPVPMTPAEADVAAVQGAAALSCCYIREH
jgi:predicted Co/Zn/Cd cation transporter (cation efflux family)